MGWPYEVEILPNGKFAVTDVSTLTTFVLSREEAERAATDKKAAAEIIRRYTK